MASTPAPLSSDVKFQEVVLAQLPERARLWVFLPVDHRRTHPCLVMAPSGSHLVTGVRMSDSVREAAIPYVRSGYAVVAYDVSGAAPADNAPIKISAAIRLFVKRQSGIADGRAAIDYTLKHLPIDPLRLYVAGDHSAGTLALLLASTDSRIRGCLAFDPVTDVPAYLAGNLTEEVQFDAPELLASLKRLSPSALADGLRCPVLLWSSAGEADESLRTYAARLRKTNHQVELMVGKGENDPAAMARDGLAWLSRDRRPNPQT